MPLDPDNLTPEASINRVRVVELPGIALPDSIRGRTAYDLCGLHVLVGMIRDAANALRVTPGDLQDAPNLPRVLADRLTCDDAVAVEAAEAICARYGESLGYIIATLTCGDVANREARPEWDESYWRHWGRMRRIVLGGGLASGVLGAAFVKHANRVMAAAGVVGCEVCLSEYTPSSLPLIGLARRVIGPERTALVVDFGQTSVKSGLANYKDGRLTCLEVGPSAPAFAEDLGLAPKMAAFIAGRFADLAPGVAPTIAVSIASYVKTNHPYEYSRSGYARLWSFTDNLGRWLSERVSGLMQRDVAIRLEHDCTAAAQTYAGDADTAVVMLGTALGAGFPSRVRQVWPLAPDFAVVEVRE